MTDPTTTRLGLQMIQPGDNVSVFPDAQNANCRILDSTIPYGEGALASRPAPGVPGRLYRATDDFSGNVHGTFYVDNGSTWDQLVTGTALVGSPLGALEDYALAADPPGGQWMICDGRAISRATYAALFALSGTASPFGVGDGSTTFTIPDCRSRASVGAGRGSGLSNRALGTTGGEEVHSLLSSEMPAHTHNVNDPGHGHGVTDPTHYHNSVNRPDGSPMIAIGLGDEAFSTGTMELTGGSQIATYQGEFTSRSGTGVSVNGAGTGVSVQNAGGSSSHNNMSPWVALNKIIRVQ